MLALFVNFGGLVWGAARISAAVDGLKTVVHELKLAVDKLDDTAHDHEARLRVLESGRDLG
jgi:hypothetical protein